MSKMHFENLQKCLYPATKITINKIHGFQGSLCFSHNIIFQNATVYINADFRSTGFTLISLQKRARGHRPRKSPQF